jgi:hypothetical protein
MVSKVIAYTMVSPDGVIGLNGRFHLLDDSGELMKFDTIQDAKDFIEEAGADPENEFTDYSELDDDDVEHDLYHDGTRVEDE